VKGLIDVLRSDFIRPKLNEANDFSNTSPAGDFSEVELIMEVKLMPKRSETVV